MQKDGCFGFGSKGGPSIKSTKVTTLSSSHTAAHKHIASYWSMLRFSASVIARHTRPRPVLAMARRTMVTVKVDDQGVALVTFNNPEKVKICGECSIPLIHLHHCICVHVFSLVLIRFAMPSLRSLTLTLVSTSVVNMVMR